MKLIKASAEYLLKLDAFIYVQIAITWLEIRRLFRKDLAD